MMEGLMRWIRGTARVRVSGDTARFVSVLVRSGISPLEMIAQEDGIQLLIRARQFRRLHPIKLRTHTKVRLLEKRGLPFWVMHTLHRPGLPTGVLLGMILYVWLSGFYWCVEIAGDAPYSKTEIMAAAEESGIFIGAKKNGVDLPTAANHFIRILPEISWASFNSEGSTITLEFHAAETKSEGVDHSGAYDIVASRDGLVKKIAAQSGTVLVQVGSAVEEGQTLVSGITVIGNPWDPNQEVRHLLSHARAEIIAETRHTFTASCPLQVQSERETETGVRKMLYVLGLRIPLSLQGAPEGEVTARDREQLILLDTAMPVWVETQRCGTLQTVTVEFSQEEALRRAKEKVRLLQENYLGETGKILSEEITNSIQDGVVYVTARCVIEENIAREAAMNGE